MHDQGMEIRQAGERDLASLISLRRQWTGGGDPTFESRWEEWFRREQDRRVFWLAVISGEPVGTTNLMVFERMPRPGGPSGRWGYLANMFVVEEHRDHGVGSALIAALIDHARRLQLVRIVLSPTVRSIPFYQRAGFGPADELLVMSL
jgi:GNAT superfamily N-acetyltransferase